MKKALIMNIAVFALIPLLLLALALGLDGLAKKNADAELAWIRETVLPNGRDFDEVTDIGTDEIIKSVYQCAEGYVIQTETQGYADKIVMYIGVTNEGNVTGLVVYEAHETLGLGSKILTDHKFLSQFLNKSGSFSVEATYGENEYTVDALTGATVSSKAVARCVTAAVAYVTGADVGSSATS